MSEKTQNEIISGLFIVVCLAALIICAVYGAKHILNRRQNEAIYNNYLARTYGITKPYMMFNCPIFFKDKDGRIYKAVYREVKRKHYERTE